MKLSAGISYMGKALKAAAVSTAAVAFLCSGVLCCCLIPSAHAKTQASKVPSCHAHKADQAKKQEPKACDCCAISKSDTDQPVKIFQLTKPSGKNFKMVPVADFWVSAVRHVVSYRIAYQGPPRTHADIPIYLQFSSLRL